MKHPENAQSELQELYSISRSKGLAHTQKEFAELLGVHPANISQFMNGSVPITEQMMRKIRNAAMAAGIIENVNTPVINAEQINAPIAQTANGDASAQSTDPRWFDLVAEKDKQIDRLLGIIEKMQQ